MSDDMMTLLSPRDVPDEETGLAAREIVACRILAQLLAAENRSFATLSSHETDRAVFDIVSIMERLAAPPARWLI